MATSKLTEPVDLRSKNKGGRPSNADRATVASMKETMRLTLADIMRSLQADLRCGALTPKEKVDLMKTYLPYIMSDEVPETEGDAMLDALAEKYLKAEIHIKSVTRKPSTK